MRAHLLPASLEVLPELLQRVVDGLAEDQLRRRPDAGGFAVVEQAWHLADLEAEAHGARIERLLREERPELADFDGAAAARARRYGSLDADEGWSASGGRAPRTSRGSERSRPRTGIGRAGRKA